MKIKLLLLVCAALSGCAAQVVSSSERTVIVRAGALDLAGAQVVADGECKKRNLFARYSAKGTPNQFIYDCVP